MATSSGMGSEGSGARPSEGVAKAESTRSQLMATALRRAAAEMMATAEKLEAPVRDPVGADTRAVIDSYTAGLSGLAGIHSAASADQRSDFGYMCSMMSSLNTMAAKPETNTSLSFFFFHLDKARANCGVDTFQIK